MRLKELRVKNKISQNEISKFINVNQSNYSKYENGTIEPNIEILKKLADYFNVTIDYLLEREQKNPLVLEEQEEAFNYLRELNGPYLQMATGYLKKLAEDQNRINNLKYRG